MLQKKSPYISSLTFSNRLSWSVTVYPEPIPELCVLFGNTPWMLHQSIHLLNLIYKWAVFVKSERRQRFKVELLYHSGTQTFRFSLEFWTRDEMIPNYAVGWDDSSCLILRHSWTRSRLHHADVATVSHVTSATSIWVTLLKKWRQFEIFEADIYW